MFGVYKLATVGVDLFARNCGDVHERSASHRNGDFHR